MMTFVDLDFILHKLRKAAGLHFFGNDGKREQYIKTSNRRDINIPYILL